MTSTHLTVALIVAAILLGEVLRMNHVSDVQYRSPDERVYTLLAQTLATRGLTGLRSLSAVYVLDEPTNRSTPPSRIGYSAAMAVVMAVTGRYDALAGSWVSCAASIAGLALIALIGMQFLNPWVAVVATFLLAVFPSDLVGARRAWTDPWISVLSYVLLYCALSLARKPSRRLALTFVLTGSVLVLSKETAVIVWGLCLLWIVIGQGQTSLPLIASTGIAGIVSFTFISWAMGGIPVFWDILSGLPGAAVGRYGLDYQSGPGYWLLEAFWITSPVTFTLALVGLVALPIRGTWRNRRAPVALAGFTLFFLVLPAILTGWLNLRYASPAYGPLCLLAAGALYLAFEELRKRISRPAMIAVTVLGCVGLILGGVSDYRYFMRTFVRTETADLSVRMVFETSSLKD